MTRLFKFILILTVCLQVSCDDKKAKEQALLDEVMSIHDEVMPEMGSLRALNKKLKLTIDSLQMDSLNVDSVEVLKVSELIQKLEQANESMMQWMRDFEPLEEGTPHGEVIQFLLEEKTKIDRVKQDMLEAKDGAEKYFLDTTN